MRVVEVIWQLEIAYLAACVIGGLAIVIRALRRAPTVSARLQLRWIVSGAPTCCPNRRLPIMLASL